MEPSESSDEVGAAVVAPDRAEPPERPRRHRLWIWVSALLAIVAVGLAVWALTIRSDRNDTQQQLDATTQEVTSTKQELDATKEELATAQQELEDVQTSQRRRTALGLVTGKVLYDEFATQLGATRDELAQTQQDVESANQAATQAEQDAAAAEQDAAAADTEKDKAKAEAKQAKAETEAAQSKAQAAAGCAWAYVEALGGLLAGDDPRAQAASVRKDLQSVTADCKDALAAAQPGA